jgi:hypothetical protein
MFYNEPDFVNVKSLLEIACEARGFRAVFFLKFHCELNFIESVGVIQSACIVNSRCHPKRLILNGMFSPLSSLS